MMRLPETLRTEALIGWNDVAPDHTTVDRVVDLARRTNVETVLYVVSALNLMLGTIRGPVPNAKLEQQIGLSQDLLPAQVVGEVVRRLRRGDFSVVFHQEQLLFAARIAIEFGQPGHFQPVDRELVGELLLRMNDLLISRPGRTRDDFVAMALRQLGAFSHEQERYLLARYHDLLVTRARAGSQPTAFDSAFQSFSHGLSIDSFLALGLAYTGLFAGIQRPPDLAGFDRIVQDVEARLASSPEAMRVRDLLTAEPTWYQKPSLVLTSLPDIAASNLVKFYERPLVRLMNGSALPISLRMSLERLSSGLYWSAFTARRNETTGVVDLNAYLGALFQDYILDALCSAYRKGGRHLAIAETEIEGSGGQISCPDAVLIDGTLLVSIECTVTGLKMETMVTGNAEEFRRELRSSKFKRKLMQPVDGATNLLRGLLNHPAVSRDAITDVYPVVISLWPFPQFVSTRFEVDKVYKAPDQILTKANRAVRCHALQFLSAEEFEMLEPGMTFGAGLTDALADKESGDPNQNTSMKNYMFTRVARENENARMAGLFTKMIEESRPILGKAFGETDFGS